MCVCVCSSSRVAGWSRVRFVSGTPLLCVWISLRVVLRICSAHIGISAMPWLQCAACRWLQQRGHFRSSCAEPLRSRTRGRPGKAPSATTDKIPPTKPQMFKTLGAAPVDMLRQRWANAHRSSTQPSHRKVELICCHCHSLSFNTRNDYSLTNAYTLIPRQWPPLGVPSQVLERFSTYLPALDTTFGEKGTETAAPTTALANMAAEPDDATAAAVAGPGPYSSLTVAQLKTEISALEEYMRECEHANGFFAISSLPTFRPTNSN